MNESFLSKVYDAFLQDERQRFESTIINGVSVMPSVKDTHIRVYFSRRGVYNDISYSFIFSEEDNEGTDFVIESEEEFITTVDDCIDMIRSHTD